MAAVPQVHQLAHDDDVVVVDQAHGGLDDAPAQADGAAAVATAPALLLVCDDDARHRNAGLRLPGRHAFPAAAPPSHGERRDLTEVIEDRADRASTLIASQLPVTDWHTVIGDSNQADAICDRLLHDAHRIELKGRSMRRTHRAPKTRTTETT